MNFNDIVNDLVLLNPSELAHSLTQVTKDLIQTLSFVWSLLSYNFINFDFNLLGYSVDLQINGFFLFTIGGLVLFIWLKLYAMIPVLPD